MHTQYAWFFMSVLSHRTGSITHNPLPSLLTSPQYPLSLVPENRLGESMCCVIKFNLPKKEIAISLTNLTLPSCASIDVITMLFTAAHCNCKNTQIVLSLGGVNDFLSDARQGKI